MGYSSQTLVKKLLAQALTSATPDTLDDLGDLLNVGNTLDTNLVTSDVVNTYIADADSDINSSLNQLYATPLKQIADEELSLTGNVDAGDNEISLNSVAILIPGDRLVLVENGEREDVEIASISGKSVTLTATLSIAFTSSARVVRIKFPDPIPYISARFAAANIYDKYFAAQASPNESKYGQFLRELASTKLTNVLQGVTILHGQHRIGNLTANPNLIKRYGTPQGMNPEHSKLEGPRRS